jgi:hypothetical protein
MRRRVALGHRIAALRQRAGPSRSVKAGASAPTDTEPDLGTVKLEETRPAKEEEAPPAAGGTMPDSGGKSVKAARTALDSGTSTTRPRTTGCC